jgi:S-layer protein (TIGR01567 family)
MKPYIKKFLLSLLAVFFIFLMLAPSGFAAPSGPVIRGLPYDTNETLSDGFIWNATTFGAFNYPVNKHKDFVASENWWGERLQYIEKDGQNELGKNNPGNHVISEDELVYSTRQFSNKYEMVSELELNANTTPSKLGGMFYYKLAWFGKPYVTVENDATQLANIVISQTGDEKQALKTGDTWDLGKNYSLTVHQVDVDGKKVWFTLYKNGKELDSGIVNGIGSVSDRTFTATEDFGDGKDQLYFITYVDNVFVSANDAFAVFKYTWLIDKDDVMVIEEGDKYQGLEVKEASKDGIVLINSKSITLNLDKDVKNYFTDSWYFQTSDAGKGSISPQGYVIYPAVDIVFENKNGSGPASNSESAKGLEHKEATNLTETNLSGANATGNSIEANVTETTSNITKLEINSNESAPNIQSSFANSNDSNNKPEKESEEKASVKAPGFEIVLGIVGLCICKGFLLKRKN